MAVLIKNVWYIAAHADELVPGGVLGRTIAGEAMVFCRRPDGLVFALKDRCAHRLTPLSLGEMIDGALRCGYHGATFDAEGWCIRIPGQDTVPAGMRVRPFPTKETYGLIWVWPGDPALSADQSSIPGFLKYGCPPYEYRNGQMLSFASDYRLVVDNLLDPTHAEFVHRSSFGSSDWQAARESEETRERTEKFTVEMRDEGIDFTFFLDDTVGGPCWSKVLALKQGGDHYEGRVDIQMDVNWAPPGLFSYALQIKPVGAEPDERVEVINLHLLTPETETTCHYLYRCSTYSPERGSEIEDFWFDTCKVAFLEDKHIIEAQQRRVGPRDLLEHPLRDLEGDVMSLKGREILKSIYAKETQEVRAQVS